MNQATTPGRRSVRRLLAKALGTELIITGAAAAAFLVGVAVSAKLRQDLYSEVGALWWGMGLLFIPAIFFGIRLVRGPSGRPESNTPTPGDSAPKGPKGDTPDLGVTIVRTVVAMVLILTAIALFLTAGGYIAGGVMLGFGLGGVGPDGLAKDPGIGFGVGMVLLGAGYAILLLAFVLYGSAQRLKPLRRKRQRSKPT